MPKKPILIFVSLSLIYAPIVWPGTGAKNEILASTPSSTPKSNSQTTHQSTMLYGRIEQIAGNSGAQFPIVLQAQSAKLDARQSANKAQRGQASTFSGSLVRSFPQQFTGIWGGHLKIWTSQMDNICWQIDPDEANRTRQLLTPGREGSVNFDFSQNTTGKIDLDPAQVIFMVPMKDTHIQEQLNSMLGNGALGQAGGASGLTLPGIDSKQMANMMQEVAGNMTVPIMVSFGAINNSAVEGVSGNSIKAIVLSNTIRQLSPGVLEQQIVAQESQRNNKTGKTRQEYSETVVRFTSQNNNDLYVQAAAVNYTYNRQFERKLILYGTVRRGQVMQEAQNPLGGLNILPGNSQLPQMPTGANPFQGLLPH